ncbi:hypothetical protein [Sphingomonas paeninsulae]|nr:hypothetical protein [Sphingomonas paeninsulae]
MNVNNVNAKTVWSDAIETTLHELDALMIAIRYSEVSLEARAALVVDIMEMRHALGLEKLQLIRKDI